MREGGVHGSNDHRFFRYLSSWIPQKRPRKEEAFEETTSAEFWSAAFERANNSEITQDYVDQLLHNDGLLDVEFE